MIFPITDALGRPIAFGGRTLGDDPAKYLNSPETPLFQKGENVYGLVEAREAIEKERRAVVVEGYTDVVMPHQVGVTNVVATLGTALTAEHVRLLKRYADEVVLVFDSDLAGRRAADRGMELFLAEDVSVRVAVLPEGKDPFDVARDEGAEALRGYLGAARDALEYKWDQVRTEWRANESPAAQRRALEAMLQSLAAMPGFDAATGIRRDMMLGRIARTLGVTEQALRGELSRIRRRPGRTGAGLETPERADVPAARGPRYGAERDLMTALVHFPARFDEIDAALPREGLRAERLRGLYEAIRASGGRRDRDVESLVRSIEDPATSALAVELYERGEAIEASRPESDTGPGPLARMLEEAAGAILDLEENERLAARGRAAREAEDADEALRAFAESRSRRQGFLPPSARRPGGAETA